MPSTPLASEPTIELLPGTVASDQRLAEALTDLVNDVYDIAEAGLWVDGATRTTVDEMGQMIAGEEIAVARVDGEVVGCVRIQHLDDGIGEFGMLVTHPAQRGNGVGRKLVDFAEEVAQHRGSTIMQLELLQPRGWTHPEKEVLDAWYTRLGYRPVRTGRIEESYPHLSPLLAGPSDFVIYHKRLRAPEKPSRP
jgi:GNAT superfamily N-acetyltransferase